MQWEEHHICGRSLICSSRYDQNEGDITVWFCKDQHQRLTTTVKHNQSKIKKEEFSLIHAQMLEKPTESCNKGTEFIIMK